jgi:hypothetical protein
MAYFDVYFSNLYWLILIWLYEKEFVNDIFHIYFIAINAGTFFFQGKRCIELQF